MENNHIATIIQNLFIKSSHISVGYAFYLLLLKRYYIICNSNFQTECLYLLDMMEQVCAQPY